MSRDSRPWIKVSVDMWRHPKIRQLTAAQFRTLIALWSMSMEYQTDGVLDVKFARAQGLRPACLTALAEAGLMDLSDDGQTLRLHDYLEHQMSADKIAARTNQRRSAGRRGGIAKAANAAEHQPIPDVSPATSSGPTQRRVEPLLSDEYKPYSATSKALTQRRRNHEMAGQQVDGFSEPLRHTRGRARAAEEEREEEHHIPPNAAASLNASRDTEAAATRFADGTLIGEPPPPDPGEPHHRGEIVHAPAVIDAPPRAPARAEPAGIRRARELNQTACSAHAIEVARGYSTWAGGGIDTRTQTEIAHAVDPLLADGIDPHQIAAGIKTWHASDSWSPTQIRRFVAKAARTADQPLTKATRKAADTLTAAEAIIADLRKDQPA